MGSKEEDVPKEPVEKTLFMEDMNENELATAVNYIFTLFSMLFSLNVSLVGITCWPNKFGEYMLSECYCAMFKNCSRIKGIAPNIRGRYGAILSPTSGPSDNSGTARIVRQHGQRQHRVPNCTFACFAFGVSAIRRKNEHGGFAQQDANECWTELVRMLQNILPVKKLEGVTTQEQFKSVFLFRL